MGITLAQIQLALPDGGTLVGNPETMITAPIVEDSRAVQTGGMFVARRGMTVDGHRYIDVAVERGAVAILCEVVPPQGYPVPYILVSDAAQALGWACAAYYGFPSRRMTIIGVTGTDGKTTTSTLIHAILKQSTHAKAGLISTISADFGDGEMADTGLHVTSPSAPDLQYYLSKMLERGLTHVVVEMTSHGLAQGRLNGVDVDIAVMTNVTHEHLDYHGTWEAYRDAKAILFRRLMQSERTHGQAKVAIINGDDRSSDYFRNIPAEEQVTYGLTPQADIIAQDIHFLPDKTIFRIDDIPFEINLAGRFMVYNALAAICATRCGLRMSFESIQRGLKSVSAISGRMQRIHAGQDFTAMVDFAHTPNALENVLLAGLDMLEPNKRLIVVFGCAGLRDRAKRRMMPQTAIRLAHISIFTAEDPRTESLEDILHEMKMAAEAVGGVEGQHFFLIKDRGRALFEACQMAQPGDLVIASGKGHEQSMCFDTTEYPWDDREAMRSALAGQPLLTLPTAFG